MIDATRRAGPAVLAAVMLMAACDGGPAPEVSAERGPVARITTGNGTVDVRVEIADSSEERQKGLMGRRSLEPQSGMVFLYEDETELSFWMRETLIPLSVAAWDERGRITTIVDMVPCRADPCEIYPLGRGVGALEVNRGFFAEKGVEVGDRIRVLR
ncbi:MAG TPA: DUF192 domain-containing protein [Actinomycetota bacterium]|nr:DUF192 domain-containing protein [Actinomycetota bacterium]